MNKHLVRCIATVLLLAAMVFLLPSPAALSEGSINPLPIDLSAGPLPDPKAYGADGLSYEDGSLTVVGGRDRAYDTNYLYLHVKIKDASQLRSAAAGAFNSQHTNRGSAIAKRQNAVLAINGDFYSMDAYSVTIRQGVPYRNRPTGEDVLLIDSAGDFHAIKAAASADQVKEKMTQIESDGKKIYNTFSFGPLLMEDNQVLIPDRPDYQYFKIGAQVHAQRISFSQLGPLEYLIVATDGPDNKDSRGVNVFEIASLTKQVADKFSPKGCLISYNLDGGSSSTVILNNEKINAIGGKVRPLSDIIYFATLGK